MEHGEEPVDIIPAEKIAFIVQYWSIRIGSEVWGFISKWKD